MRINEQRDEFLARINAARQSLSELTSRADVYADFISRINLARQSVSELTSNLCLSKFHAPNDWIRLHEVTSYLKSITDSLDGD